MYNLHLQTINYAHYWLYSLSLLLLPSSLCFDYSMGCFPPILSATDYRVLSAVVLAALAVTELVLVVAAEERIKK